MKIRNRVAAAALITALLCGCAQSAWPASLSPAGADAMGQSQETSQERQYEYDSRDDTELPPFSFDGVYGSESWKLVSQNGGSMKCVYQENDIIYIGCGVSVLAINAGDPDHLCITGTSGMLPQTIESISGDGRGNLFVACGTGGMVVLNAAGSSDLKIIGYLDTRGYTEKITVAGEYALIADGPQGIQIADISDRAAPVWIAEAYPLAYVYDIAVAGTTAYAAAGGSGVLAVDIADPRAPVEKGLVNLDGFQYDVEVSGGTLYAAGAWGGVSVLDIADPGHPALMTTLETFGWAMSVQMTRGRLFVSEGANGVRVYGPGGGEAIAVYNQYVGFVLDFAVVGDTAYLVDKEKGLVIVSFQTMEHPKLKGRWMPLTDGYRVTMDGRYCYVAGGLSGMHVYDLGNLRSPAERYWYDTESGYANQVIVDRGRAFLCTHLDSQETLVSFTVTDPLAIVKGDVLDYGETQYLGQIAGIALSLQNDLLYIHGEWNLVSVDVSSLDRLKILDCLRLDSGGGDVCGNLLVTATNHQVYTVDVSDPDHLQVLSELPCDTAGGSAVFIDPTTVLVSTNGGIAAVDVSDPYAPAVISNLNLAGTVMDFCRDGSTVYMAAQNAGVHAVDVSDPEKLRHIETIQTPGSAFGCWAKDDLLVVADNTAGLAVFQRGTALQATLTQQETGTAAAIPLTVNRKNVSDESGYLQAVPGEKPGEAYEALVTSTADSGPGTLRDALIQLRNNTTITFDPDVFPPQNPAVIALDTALPVIERDFITIDASGAGVILDGRKVNAPENRGEGAVNGLHLMGYNGKVIGMQIVNFPDCGIRSDAPYAQIGGDRGIGAGPVGQGNQIGGCRMGLLIGGWGSVIQGNLVGVDVTGTAAMPNDFTNVFITGDFITAGGTKPGEANVISGSGYSNLTCWGDHVRIIGNLIGTDITGTAAIDRGTMFNVLLEYGTTNTTVGGTAAGERNIISGAQYGVVFSDLDTYQCSVIGNYIGTDISGTRAVPNQNGFDCNNSGFHRIGGKNPGEGNVISGNGCGVGIRNDCIVIGNRIGYAAGEENALPNDTGITLYSGSVIGGYTPEEGNLVNSTMFAVRSGMSGVSQSYVAGNTFINERSSGLWIEEGASRNFFQNNSIVCGDPRQFAVVIDGGTGNSIRSNRIFLENPSNMILLPHGGNLGLAAPTLSTAEGDTVKGTACAFAVVEIYRFEEGQATPIGSVTADARGAFAFVYTESLGGQQILLLATDLQNNTSAFSAAYTVKK